MAARINIVEQRSRGVSHGIFKVFDIIIVGLQLMLNSIFSHSADYFLAHSFDLILQNLQSSSHMFHKKHYFYQT